MLFYFFSHKLRLYSATNFLQSEVFAVAFALLAAGAVILTLNVLLLVATSHFSLSAFMCAHLFSSIHLFRKPPPFVIITLSSLF